MQEQVEQDNKKTDTTSKKPTKVSTPTTAEVEPVVVDVTKKPEWMLEENEPNFAGISQRDVKYWVYHPYDSNLWRVHIEKGNLPPDLSGLYTSKDSALDAVKFYLENIQKPINTSSNRRAKKAGKNSKEYVLKES